MRVYPVLDTTEVQVATKHKLTSQKCVSVDIHVRLSETVAVSHHDFDDEVRQQLPDTDIP